MNTRLSVTHVALASALIAGGLFAAGCTVQATAAPPPSGQVTFDWSIDESTDPNLCAQSSASSLHIEIIDQSTNNTVTDYSAPCVAGATTITLTQGLYSAQAWLEDSSNVNRTTMVSIAPFTINSVPLDISIDFPASSFE